MAFNVLYRLSLFSILLVSYVYCVKSSNTQSAMFEIIMNDIESAFKSVTNITNTMLREHIIPELYNITSKSDFLFKIPKENDKLGYSIISMERSELMKPIFPNLSLNHEEMMIKSQQFEAGVRRNQQQNSMKSPITEDIWSILGLEGWSGELAPATDLLETKHKDNITARQMDNYTASYDLNKGPDEINDDSVNKSIPLTADFHSIKPNATTSTSSTFADISDNVYIARANNPFGLSTKWTLRRNVTANTTKDERSKRALVELYSMIKCATGCEPLTYQSYGCFCGFLGNGIAVDGIDSCCKQHDKCYEQSTCVSYQQYFVPYIWKCYRGKPICALNHGQFGGPASCAALLCYCDMKLAICLRKFSCPQCKAVCRASLARKLQNLFL